MTTLLSVDRLSIFDERGLPLVRDISFSLSEGEALFLVGETGCGKTLLSQAIAGTLPARLSARGEILFRGKNLLEMTERERQELWGREIFLLPQEPFAALNPVLSVYRQVREIFQKVRKMHRHEASEKTGDLFSSLGISRKASFEPPRKLSGGMAQRALLAAALASSASFILLDEPTKGLDSSLKEEALFLVKGILENGKTLLCITHDLSLPLETEGKTAVLFGGLLVEFGESRKILSAPSHAYTRGLLNALPERGLHPIPEDLLQNMERAWIL